MNPTSEPADPRITAELRTGERLVWFDRPNPGRFQWSAWGLVLFGVPWTAFAIFWVVFTAGAMSEGRTTFPTPGFGFFSLCFPLFGLPFVLVGFYMLSAPFWMRRLAQRTWYAITDQRAIVSMPGWFGSLEVRSYGSAELTKILRRDFADGSGDLVFEEEMTISGSRGHQRTISTERGFMGIAEVRKVEALLHATLLTNNAGAPEA